MVVKLPRIVVAPSTATSPTETFQTGNKPPPCPPNGVPSKRRVRPLLPPIRSQSRLEGPEKIELRRAAYHQSDPGLETNDKPKQPVPSVPVFRYKRHHRRLAKHSHRYLHVP